MQDNAPTPVRDFISVDDAILLIKGHKANEPTILPSKLRVSYGYIKPQTNITLFQAKLGRMKNGKIGAVPTAPVFVRVNTTIEAELLKQAIKEKVEELTLEEFSPNPAVFRTTEYTEGNERCFMQNNDTPNVKVGQVIRD